MRNFCFMTYGMPSFVYLFLMIVIPAGTVVGLHLYIYGFPQQAEPVKTHPFSFEEIAEAGTSRFISHTAGREMCVPIRAFPDKNEQHLSVMGIIAEFKRQNPHLKVLASRVEDPADPGREWKGQSYAYDLNLYLLTEQISPTSE